MWDRIAIVLFGILTGACFGGVVAAGLLVIAGVPSTVTWVAEAPGFMGMMACIFGLGGSIFAATAYRKGA